MAKLKGALQITGMDKKANKQYVERKDGIYVKELPPAGIHRDEPALKKNYTATAGINKLASQVNTVMKYYAAGFLEQRRYDVLRSQFFKVPQEKRLWRLKCLEGMEGHTKKKVCELLNPPRAALILKKNIIILPLIIFQHPKTIEGEHYYHYHRIVLMLWNSKDDSYTHQSKRTEWVAINDDLPLEYEFEFEKKPDSTEWLILLCLVRGEDKNEDRMPPDKNIMILQAGSFDKKAEVRYDAWLAEKNIVKTKPRRKTATDDVVMPKKVKDATQTKEAVVVPKKRVVKKKIANKKGVGKKRG